jgi:uncharacterized protein (TIGR00369 family)
MSDTGRGGDGAREAFDPPGEGWLPLADETFVGGLGRIFERRRDGRVEIALCTDERHRNLSGIVHGGVIMTALDRAVGVSCRALSDGVRVATATLTVNFLRQVRVGDVIVVRGLPRKAGRKAIFVDAEASVGGRLVATATGICMIVG